MNNQVAYTIKTNQDLVDLSGENPEFYIPAGTIFTNAEDESEYFIVDLGDESFPIMKDECEVM